MLFFAVQASSLSPAATAKNREVTIVDPTAS